MAVKMRLARAGTKKRPYYHIVIADAAAPRDGKFIDVVGAFNPMLKKDDANRVKLDAEKAAAWLKKGAQPTDRVLRFLDKAGVAKREAICQGAESRLRPIIMTTLTTLFGFAPLAFFGGEGAEVRAPMALTVIGGLTVSTLLTLVVIPVLYYALYRRRMEARADVPSSPLVPSAPTQT